MNKSSKKIMLALIAAAALTAVPVFAKDADRKHGGPDGDGENRSEKMERGCGMMRIQTMGTVKSITKDMLVITDADGKEIQIHLNPFTKVMKADPDGTCGPDNRPQPGKIEDVTKGS